MNTVMCWDTNSSVFIQNKENKVFDIQLVGFKEFHSFSTLAGGPNTQEQMSKQAFSITNWPPLPQPCYQLNPLTCASMSFDCMSAFCSQKTGLTLDPEQEPVQ